MADPTPASLDSAQLSRRLGELAGRERQLQVEFLLHLDVFDQRRAWAEAGYPSLWEWCLRVLHLREGATARRLAAMRVLRRFPSLAEALRDGRLCLSNLAALGAVLTAENCEEVVARAAFMTRAEVEHLVVSLKPRAAPKEGIRLVARHVPSSVASPRETPPPQQEPAEPKSPPDRGCRLEPSAEAPARPASPSRPTLTPISSSTYSLRATVDADFKKDLDELTSLLAHKFPDGDLGSVLREAVKCALQKHGQRKGAVEPVRKRMTQPPPSKSAPPETARPPRREPIPAAVRREVWKRDGGKCAWRSPDGHRCGSTWMLELDHLVSAALGGPSTVENLALHCRSHNLLRAEHAFGRDHMERFRRERPRPGEATSSGRSGRREIADGSSRLAVPP